jgi:hypothetical protein
MRLSSKIHTRLFAALFLGFLALRASATTYYVDINSPNPTPPYISWSTASTNIQAAIDQSTNGDLVLVNDGVYQTGGETVNFYSLTNRVVINKAITVQSVNGSGSTFIEGYPVGWYGVRCVYMTNNSTLIGFTITNGGTVTYGDVINNGSGAGIFCADVGSDLISNCVIIANNAFYEAGGVYQGTLRNCFILNNTSENGPPPEEVVAVFLTARYLIRRLPAITHGQAGEERTEVSWLIAPSPGIPPSLTEAEFREESKQTALSTTTRSFPISPIIPMRTREASIIVVSRRSLGLATFMEAALPTTLS